MESNSLPWGIIVINVLLLSDLIFLFVYLYRMLFKFKLSKREHSFYKLKLTKTIIFFIANLAAYFVNYKLFFADPPTAYKLFGDGLTYVRFIDRGSMLFFGLMMIIDVFQYHPAAYDDLITEDEYLKISIRFNKKATY